MVGKYNSFIADMEDQINYNIASSQSLIHSKSKLYNSVKREKRKEAIEEQFEGSMGWFFWFKERSHLHNVKV